MSYLIIPMHNSTKMILLSDVHSYAALQLLMIHTKFILFQVIFVKLLTKIMIRKLIFIMFCSQLSNFLNFKGFIWVRNT